jgi:hypothetical protein
MHIMRRWLATHQEQLLLLAAEIRRLSRVCSHKNRDIKTSQCKIEGTRGQCKGADAERVAEEYYNRRLSGKQLTTCLVSLLPILQASETLI